MCLSDHISQFGMQKLWSPHLIVSPQFTGMCNEPETPFQVARTVLPNISIRFMLYKKYFCTTYVSLHMWTYQQNEGIPKNRFGPLLLQHKSVITEIPLGSFSQFFQPLFSFFFSDCIVKFLSAHVITTSIPKSPDNG